MDEIWPWIAFTVFIVVLLALDLGVFNRRAHEVRPKEAATWVAIWVSLAAVFNAGVYHFLGMEKGLQFTTGYLIEEMLSVDNMFVFVLVMTAFRVPKIYQHKLLFYGILGALLMRGSLIAAGAWLIANFHWIFYAFGAFLLFTAFRMVTDKDSELDPHNNPIVKYISRHMPVVSEFHDGKFFIKRESDGRRAATPLFLALVCIEFTDLVFAMDSIPAIFAVTEDPFIVFTSNVFAILGLRSLYFLLSHALDKFHYLKHGIAAVLTFVGLKMLTKDVAEVPMLWSLVFIACTMAISITASLLLPRKKGTSDKEA